MKRETLLQTIAYAAWLGLLATIGWLVAGKYGLACAVLANLVCGFAIFAGRLVAMPFVGPSAVLNRMLATMLPRVFIPLAFCLVVYGLDCRSLIDGGFAFYLIATYLLMLAVETWHSARLISKSSVNASQSKTRTPTDPPTNDQAISAAIQAS